MVRMSVEFDEEPIINMNNTIIQKSNLEPWMVRFLVEKKIVKSADQAYMFLTICVVASFVIAGIIFSYLFMSSVNPGKPTINTNNLPAGLEEQLRATGQLTS
jgi:hypothetical protein